MPRRCGFVELSLAVRALDVVRVVGRGRRRQVRQLAALFEMILHLLGRAYVVDEFLVLQSPIRFRCYYFLKERASPTSMRELDEILRIYS